MSGWAKSDLLAHYKKRQKSCAAVDAGISGEDMYEELVIGSGFVLSDLVEELRKYDFTLDWELLDDWIGEYFYLFQFSRSFMSNSLRPHGPQHTRPPCPLPTPGAYSNSWLKNEELQIASLNNNLLLLVDVATKRVTKLESSGRQRKGGCFYWWIKT